MRLLPGHDQWVMGPGTADEHVVPAAWRTPVTRQANMVVVGGVVSGTWSVVGGEVDIRWFADAEPPDATAVEVEIERLSTILSLPS